MIRMPILFIIMTLSYLTIILGADTISAKLVTGHWRDLESILQALPIVTLICVALGAFFCFVANTLIKEEGY